MVTSVNTNMAAMIALQNLSATNRDLLGVQNRINTGLKVATAKDNAAIFHVAQNMRSDTSALNAVKNSMNRATSIADVAMAAAGSISDLLVRMRETVTAAMDRSIDAQSRAAYQQDFQALVRQVSSVINNANFDGANVLNGTITNGIEFLADADATQRLTLRTENMSLGGTIITLTAGASIATSTTATAVLALVQNSLNNVNSALARLGATSKRLEQHTVFISKLQDTLNSGIGNLVDADLAVESARLNALQVKQQLGTQALSIANQTPQAILSLFRGG
jgi:flagellin